MIQNAVPGQPVKNGDAVINNNGLKIVTGTRTVSPPTNDAPSLAAVSGKYVSRYKDINYYTA